jgi:hypothetical protein
MLEVVERAAVKLVALRPAQGEKILEIERRTRLQGQSMTMRHGVRLDPFSDCLVAGPDLERDSFRRNHILSC